VLPHRRAARRGQPEREHELGDVRRGPDEERGARVGYGGGPRDEGLASDLEGGGWRVEGGGWRVEGGGWRVEGGGWRVEGERHTHLDGHTYGVLALGLSLLRLLRPHLLHDLRQLLVGLMERGGDAG